MLVRREDNEYVFGAGKDEMRIKITPKERESFPELELGRAYSVEFTSL